jgi:hypothetical protein
VSRWYLVVSFYIYGAVVFINGYYTILLFGDVLFITGDTVLIYGVVFFINGYTILLYGVVLFTNDYTIFRYGDTILMYLSIISSITNAFLKLSTFSLLQKKIDVYKITNDKI